MTKEAKPDAWMPKKRIRPGATLRLEIHLSNLASMDGALSCSDIGHLFRMLAAEAARDPIPDAGKRCIQRLFDRRREFSRIRGGFGRSRLSQETRRAVFDRDGGECRYCGIELTVETFHCDHVESLKVGGSDAMENLRASCPPCNLSKAAKPLSEWRP